MSWEQENKVNTETEGKNPSGWIEGISHVLADGPGDLSWLPNGALDEVSRFVDNTEDVIAEHQALDWDALSASFPDRPDVTYARPTLTEYIAMCKAGAVQLHAVRYLAKRELKIAAVEGMSKDEYDDFMQGRNVSKEQLLEGLHARQKNEEAALSYELFAKVPVIDTEGMQKRGITGRRAFITVPATIFTELKTARAIFTGSDLPVKGNYLLPLEGDRHVDWPLLKPINEVLIPRQPQPAKA
ncbi:MAG TPA: hypothetical protein VNA13_01205 [Xanthomonadales bacterium]|nr:hypothetical protein [Xanthomonadales bacterium]